MSLNKEAKSKIIEDFKINPEDTGSSAVQVAIITERIKVLTVHLKENRHDFSSKRGLFKLIGQRRRLLRYLEQKNEEHYKSLISRLGL